MNAERVNVSLGFGLDEDVLLHLQQPVEMDAEKAKLIKKIEELELRNAQLEAALGRKQKDQFDF